MCECRNCASISPTRVRSGWKYRSIPPTRDRKICDCENLHLKKKKKKGLSSMQEFTSRKGTHYVRIYTRWNYLLSEKLCHGKCHLNKFSPPPMHDNLHKKRPIKGIYGMKKVLKSIQIRFRQVNLKKLIHQFIYPLCKRRFFTVLV